MLPKRFVPDDIMPEMDVEVFVYHDSENRLIATTQHPAGEVGDIVLLKVISVTPQGAFLDWGLMKDIFMPTSQQNLRPVVGGMCLVRIYRDIPTGRVAVTEKFANTLTNEELTVKELEPVALTIWHKTDIGYKVTINSCHTGVLHFSDVFQELETGDQLKGFIKKITPPDNTIDVMLGERGYARTIADRFATDHRERVVRSDDIGLIDTLVRHFDEPFADASALASYQVCALARERVTVALSGDGSDEAFAGYRRHKFQFV